MRRRRAFLTAATAALPLAAGCTGHLGAIGADCPGTTPEADLPLDGDPSETWRLGERIEDPDPPYEPRNVEVANLHEEREISISVTRDDADGPVLDRTVTLGVAEYVAVELLEPDAWTVTVALPDGPSKTHTLAYFDCNHATHAIGIRCGGRFTTHEASTLAECPEYPIDRSASSTLASR